MTAVSVGKLTGDKASVSQTLGLRSRSRRHTESVREQERAGVPTRVFRFSIFVAVRRLHSEV